MFVGTDIHQDDLVHVSALFNKFVPDPREVAKAGDVVKVKVLEVDAAKKRFALTMQLDNYPGAEKRRLAETGNTAKTTVRSAWKRQAATRKQPINSIKADALMKLKQYLRIKT